jgi:dihydroorotate dehydrogenase
VGANVAVLASELIRSGPTHLTQLVEELREWIEAREDEGEHIHALLPN